MAHAGGSRLTRGRISVRRLVNARRHDKDVALAGSTVPLRSAMRSLALWIRKSSSVSPYICQINGPLNLGNAHSAIIHACDCALLEVFLDGAACLSRGDVLILAIVDDVHRRWR